MFNRKSLWLAGICCCWMASSFLSAQDLQFAAPQRLANHEVLLNLTAPPQRSFRIEIATSLLAWNGLVTFPTNATTGLQYTDSAAPFANARYYRAVQVEGTNIVWGDHLATTNGDVVLQPRDHATFVMQWNGKMLYNDPAPDASYTGLPKADLVLISHSHPDHFNTGTIDAVRVPNAVLIVPQTVYTGLTAAQKLRATVLGYGASINVLGLTVEAVPAYNSYHSPAGYGNGYVLTIGGRRIYISGDTGNVPEIRALGNIDVAFLCINQPYTMTVADATNVVRTMRPKVVYPYHYRDAGGAAANAATFKQWLGSDLGIEVRLRSWY